MSFCSIDELKRLEAVCQLIGNSSEVWNIVQAIRKGLVGTESVGDIADIKDSLTHLCYMIENLNHQADVRVGFGIAFADII